MFPDELCLIIYLWGILWGWVMCVFWFLARRASRPFEGRSAVWLASRRPLWCSDVGAM